MSHGYSRERVKWLANASGAGGCYVKHKRAGHLAQDIMIFAESTIGLEMPRPLPDLVLKDLQARAFLS